MRDLFAAAWNYRYFVLSSIKNELRLRFVRSKLGGLWMILHPLMQVLIFALILSEVLSAKLPGSNGKFAYALYLMSGMLFWALFSDTLGRFTGLFIESGNLMRKISFPRICLPLIAGGTALVNGVLLLLAILVVFVCMGYVPSAAALWVPMLMLLTLWLAMSLGLILGTLNAFMRDIGQVIPVILQAMFWLTPIVYHLEVLPERYRDLFKLNPLYPLVTSFQNVMVFGQQPLWPELCYLSALALALSLVALMVFRRASAEMVDVL